MLHSVGHWALLRPEQIPVRHDPDHRPEHVRAIVDEMRDAALSGRLRQNRTLPLPIPVRSKKRWRSNHCSVLS
jgi:hypothetical protein